MAADLMPAVFLDRDGVLIEDAQLLTRPEQIAVLPGVPQALRALDEGGFKLIVVSNQTVVSRGLASEAEVSAVNVHLEALLQLENAPPLAGFYVCPHHPNATLPAYRLACECRKPKPGLLVRAAKELQIDLAGSFMVGDRITDVVAGQRAGCRTVLVKTGRHLAPPIETDEPMDTNITPDHACASLLEAADWILRKA